MSLPTYKYKLSHVVVHFNLVNGARPFSFCRTGEKSAFTERNRIRIAFAYEDKIIEVIFAILLSFQLYRFTYIFRLYLKGCPDEEAMRKCAFLSRFHPRVTSNVRNGEKCNASAGKRSTDRSADASKTPRIFPAPVYVSFELSRGVTTPGELPSSNPAYLRSDRPTFTDNLLTFAAVHSSHSQSFRDCSRPR